MTSVRSGRRMLLLLLLLSLVAVIGGVWAVAVARSDTIERSIKLGGGFLGTAAGIHQAERQVKTYGIVGGNTTTNRHICWYGHGIGPPDFQGWTLVCGPIHYFNGNHGPRFIAYAMTGSVRTRTIVVSGDRTAYEPFSVELRSGSHLERPDRWNGTAIASPGGSVATALTYRSPYWRAGTLALGGGVFILVGLGGIGWTLATSRSTARSAHNRSRE